MVCVQSGTAPLAPRLVELVKEAEARLDGDVRRAAVIDAEGSTFDILEAFTKEGRVIVTPLRPSRAPSLQLEYSRGSSFRPYRDNDELRIASAVLTHKSTRRSLEVGALVVRREHRDSDTVLLTTGLSLGMEGRDLADLYFARWPVQYRRSLQQPVARDVARRDEWPALLPAAIALRPAPPLRSDAMRSAFCVSELR